jgi:hypothetical protein
MQKRYRTRIQITTFLCAVAVVLVSAVPLLNRQNDALVLTLLASAFGAGAMLSTIIQDTKQNKRK